MLRNSSLFPSFFLSPLQEENPLFFLSLDSGPVLIIVSTPARLKKEKMMCSQDPLPFPLPVFETRFTSTELDELLSFFQPTENNNNIVDSVDENSSPQPVSSNSDSDDPNNDGEEEDEKKKKRKRSNRESARRSRWRKKRHLENLTAEMNRLKAQNRKNTSRLGLVLNQLRAVKMQNELMRFECVRLIQRNAGLNRVLQAMEFNNNTTNNTNSDRFADGNALFNSLQRHPY